VRIVQLQINNLFPYKKANIHFESYNVIVGANASGKTNIIRILDRFLRSDGTTIDDRRLPLDLKYDRNLPSSLRIDISLTKHEAKILLELILNKKLENYLFDENLTHISLNLEWTKFYDDDSPPDNVILYFNNHLAMWKGDARINITYITSFPETIEDLKSDINESIVIDNDETLKERYHDKGGFSHPDLFSQNSFQEALLKCGYDQIKDFFEVEDKRIRITQNTALSEVIARAAYQVK
jgi:AAA15 family ATPase/GTPase